MCDKPKVGSDSVLKTESSKFDIRSVSFPTESAFNQQFKLKVTKITSLAFIVQIKNVLKH